MNLQLNLSNTALIIVDAQNDFCMSTKTNNIPNHELVEIKKVINKISKFYDIAASMGLKIIFTKFTASEDISPKNLKRVFEKEDLAFITQPKSSGYEFYKIAPKYSELVIQKRNYDAFSETNLNVSLKEFDIENIAFCGIRTELGIDSTAKRAFMEGYNVIILNDLIETLTSNKELQEKTLEGFAKYFGYSMNSREFIKHLKTQSSLNDL